MQLLDRAAAAWPVQCFLAMQPWKAPLPLILPLLIAAKAVGLLQFPSPSAA